MSGGSYNYLCYRLNSLFDTSVLDDLKDMVTTLEEDYPNTKAAIDARTLLNVMNESDDLEITNLKKVFRQVEWHSSGDISKETLDEEIANYEKY